MNSSFTPESLEYYLQITFSSTVYSVGDITEKLDISPTRSLLMGEKDKQRNIPKTNMWIYQCGNLFDDIEKNKTFEVIENIFMPKTNLIRELSYEVFAEMVVVNMEGEFSGDLNLSKKILTFIAESGLNFSMAIYSD